MTVVTRTDQSAQERVQHHIDVVYPKMLQHWLSWQNQKRAQSGQGQINEPPIPVPKAIVHPSLGAAFRTFQSDVLENKPIAGIAVLQSIAADAPDHELEQLVTTALGDLFTDRANAENVYAGPMLSDEAKDVLAARVDVDKKDPDDIRRVLRSGPGSALGLIAIGVAPRFIPAQLQTASRMLIKETLGENHPELVATDAKIREANRQNDKTNAIRLTIEHFLHHTKVGRFIDKSSGWLLRPTLLRPLLKEPGPSNQELFGELLDGRPTTPSSAGHRERPSGTPSVTSPREAGVEVFRPPARTTAPTERPTALAGRGLTDKGFGLTP
jgi:hypothetical protein